jgi:hypothetical protein
VRQGSTIQVTNFLRFKKEKRRKRGRSHLVEVVEVADVTLLGRGEHKARGEQGEAEGSHAVWRRGPLKELKGCLDL